jgi:hypothetical protein
MSALALCLLKKNNVKRHRSRVFFFIHFVTTNLDMLRLMTLEKHCSVKQVSNCIMKENAERCLLFGHITM